MENCLEKIKEIKEFEEFLFSRYCDVIKAQGRLHNWSLLYVEYSDSGVFVTGKCFKDANASQVELYFGIEHLEKNDEEWAKHVLEIKRNKEERDKKIQREIEAEENRKKLESFFKLKAELMKLNLING